MTQETIAEESEDVSAPQEDSSEQDSNTVSAFLERVLNATEIEDPYTFKYSDKVTPPKPEAKIEGVKFRYDPEFLLQFAPVTKFTVDKDFAQKIEFITKDTLNNRGGSAKNRGGFKFGMGSGLSGSQGFPKSSSRRNYDMNSRSNSRQNSKRRGASNRGDRKSNRNREREPREPDVPAEPVKPLEKSENRWIPKSRANKTTEVKYAPDGVTVLLSEEDVNRKVKSLLNKLTLEFFDEISDEILAIANQSKWEENAETLKQVLNITFDKATDEPHWSEMYASLCAKLMASIDDEVKDESAQDPRLTGKLLARKLLLSKCQTEYEKGWTDKLPTNEDGSPLEPELMTDEYYIAAAAKRRGLGLVRFIGHLFVLRLLSAGVIRSCLVKLSENTVDPTDDTVENLIQLIKTVGPTLDSSPTGSSVLTAIFEKIKPLEDSKIPSRLQFALMDLRDLRRKSWAGLENKGPKTISQIHEEARKKEEEQKNDRKKQNKSDSRQGSSRNSGWGNSRVSESDFRRVGQINSSSSSSNLGPMNNFTKSRSSRKATSSTTSTNTSNDTTTERSDSSRQNSQRPGAANRFALLNGEDDDDDDSSHVASEEPKPEPNTETADETSEQ